MKKIILALLTFTAPIAAMSQATQPCIVKQYNQKQQKTPLGGVQVTVGNAGSATSGADGQLTLTFRTQKPGEKVNFISAKKTGYELMNKAAVEQWNISRDNTPFIIVLVRSNYFSQLKDKLTQTSTDTYKAKYEQALQDLEKQKKAGRLKEEEYNKSLDELEAKYQEQLSNLENYIDQFARIDLSEVSAEEQRILDMVQEGKIDEAVKAYDKLGLVDKFATEASSYKTLNDAAKRIAEEQANRKTNIDELYEAVQREVATLILAYKYSQASEKLITLLESMTPLFEQNPDEFRPRMAKTQLMLGEFSYSSKEKKEHLLAALQHYDILYAQDPDIYLEDWAKSNLLSGLNYYVDSNDKIKYLAEAVKGYTKLSAQSPDNYLKELAKAHYELGRRQRFIDKYDDAEVNLLEAARIYHSLYLQDSAAYVVYLAQAKCDLARVYAKLLDIKTHSLKDKLDKCPVMVSYLDHDNYIKHLTAIRIILFDKTNSRDLAQKVEKCYLEAIQYFEEAFDSGKEWYYDYLMDYHYDIKMLIDAQDGLERYYETIYDYEKAEHVLWNEYDNCKIKWEGGSADLEIKYNIIPHFLFLYTNENFMSKIYYRCSKEFGDSLTKKLTLELKKAEERLPEDFKDDYDSNKKREHFTNLLYILGNYWTEQGDLEKAESYFGKLKDYNQDYYGFNLLALKFAEKQDYEKAEAWVKKALPRWGSDPDWSNAKYLITKGKILLMQGDEDGAYQMWKQHRRYAKDEVYEGYTLIEDLSKANPDAYLPQLASVQYQMGGAFYDCDYNDMARHYYSESMNNYSQLYEQAKEDNPNKNTYYENVSGLLYNIGLTYYYTERYSEAKDAFSMVEKREEEKGKASERLAKTLHMQYKICKKENKSEKALDFLRKAVITSYQAGVNVGAKVDLSNYCEELYWKALQEMKDGKYKDAEKDWFLQIELLEEITACGWNSDKKMAISLSRLSYNYIYQGKYDKALKTFDKVFEIVQKKEYFVDSKRHILLMKGDEQEVKDLWQKIQKKYASNTPHAYQAGIQRCMGYLYEEIEDEVKAESYYLEALKNYSELNKKQPDDYRAKLAWVQYNLMYLYEKDNHRLDQYDEMLDAALANYELLFQSNNKDYQSRIVDLRNSKGWRLLRKDSIDEAMSLFESTYQLDPKESAPYLASGCNVKAYMYARTKDFDNAIKTINRAISLRPYNANYYDSKGEILLMKGDEQEAVKMWQKVLELDSDFLSKHNGSTPFYEQLKEKGLIH